MLDRGQRATERIFADVQRRLKRTYRGAIKDVQAKLEAFEARHAAADARWRKMLADGKTNLSFQDLIRVAARTGVSGRAMAKEVRPACGDAVQHRPNRAEDHERRTAERVR